MSFTISSRLKYIEKPNASRMMNCQAVRVTTLTKGQLTDMPIIKTKLSCPTIAQGELSLRLWMRDQLIPKSILDIIFKKKSLGLLSYITIDPPIIPPKMIKQKQPCRPAKDYHKIAKIIPPEALQPQLKEKQIASKASTAAILSLLSFYLSGKQGINLFFLNMKTRLKTKLTKKVQNRNCTIVIPSSLAIEKFIRNKMGERSNREIFENYILGSSPNYLYSYSCFYVMITACSVSPIRRFLACASLRYIDFSNLANICDLFVSSLLGGRILVLLEWKLPLKDKVQSKKDVPICF